MSSPTQFHGPNIGYVIELYEQYRDNPESLDADTRAFFAEWSPIDALNGAVTEVSIGDGAAVDMKTVVGAVSFARSIRQFGHLAARLDPLGTPPPDDPELSPDAHGITYDDLHNLPAGLIIDGPIARSASSAYEAIQELRNIYCSTTGYDNEHISNPEQRNWLREAIESRRYRFDGSGDEARDVLRRLSQVEALEQFLQRTFPTKYRFSIEGLDVMVPMLDEIVNYAKTSNVELMMLAMAHRGRLNVLAHIMDKPYQRILADFKDTRERIEEIDAVGYTVDDVKYHKGAVNEVEDSQLTIKMPFNPSHLEQVNPVTVGRARAAGTDRHQPGYGNYTAGRTMQVIIHGDAAFTGQGIVAETFNLSRLPGYRTGGTLHIIANNQLGFTTNPEDGRSTMYASDLAKGYRVPIVHVNADDPAACIEVARLAFEFQNRFEKDFLIDLIGYRRHGHNELDQPGFTQPLMYRNMDEHPRVRQVWANTLAASGSVSAEDAEAYVDEFMDLMRSEYDAMKADQEGIADPNPKKPPQGAAKEQVTAIDETTLHEINDGLSATYEGFNFFPSGRLEKSIRSRRDLGESLDDPAIDWATAEELAFATILAEGTPIRLTGQDSQRGTFSHRHAVLHDVETGEELVPLHRFPQAKAAFDIYNSPLSEAAVVAFEYGYNIESEDSLVIWEAQYGDFVNGAQTIIDEFVTSAREKWGLRPSLVMLLPHGHEGAGPDHSSGRVERFLELAAKTNMRIANCTTAAQFFHLLRRQALLLKKDPLPLIVMTPKSLLRNPNVYSSLRDFTEGRWQPVLDDADVTPDDVTRLVFCSGKFYYDMATSEYRDHYPHVALVRIEQVYPFPLDALRDVLSRYPNVTQIVWAQEEPKNMGAWEFMSYRLKKMVGMGTPVNYVGRRRSSSPAEGSKTAWSLNQAMITEFAFDWDFDSDSTDPLHEDDEDDIEPSKKTASAKS